MPATMQKTATRTYMSPNASLMVPLRPPLEIDDPRSGKRVAEPGIMAKFEHGRFSTSDPETIELLESSPYFTGEGAIRRVWGEGDLMAPAGSGPLGLKHGALTSAAARQVGPPLEGWNEAGAVDLAARIGRGEVRDLEAALSYELANKRRKTVARALTDQLLGDERPEQPAPTPPPAAAIPAGQGGF